MANCTAAEFSAKCERKNGGGGERNAARFAGVGSDRRAKEGCKATGGAGPELELLLLLTTGEEGVEEEPQGEKRVGNAGRKEKNPLPLLLELLPLEADPALLPFLPLLAPPVVPAAAAGAPCRIVNTSVAARGACLTESKYTKRQEEPMEMESSFRVTTKLSQPRVGSSVGERGPGGEGGAEEEEEEEDAAASPRRSSGNTACLFRRLAK